MNKLYIGDKEVLALNWGDKEVVALYKGAELLWEKPYLTLKNETIFIFNTTADNEIISNVKWNVNQ